VLRAASPDHINSHKLRNLCLFAHDCLFDRSINSKRCLFGRIVGRDHLRISTIKGAGGQNRSLARSQYPPRKFATEFPRSNSIVIKIIAWGKFPRLKITPNAKQGEREGKY